MKADNKTLPTAEEFAYNYYAEHPIADNIAIDIINAYAFFRLKSMGEDIKDEFTLPSHKKAILDILDNHLANLKK